MTLIKRQGLYLQVISKARGGKLIPKIKSTIKLVEIKESLDICDIWKTRNTKRQNFTFRQNHSTGFTEH